MSEYYVWKLLADDILASRRCEAERARLAERARGNRSQSPGVKGRPHDEGLRRALGDVVGRRVLGRLRRLALSVGDFGTSSGPRQATDRRSCGR